MRLLGRWNWWLPGTARASDGAPAGPGTRAGGRPMSGRATAFRPLDAVGGCGPRGAAARWLLRRADPRQPAGRATPRHRRRPPHRRHASDPQPIVFPRDDGPHDRLTEWWYYTGHLVSDAGRRFGFEYVVFRAERGAFPVSWASHLALTDEQGQRFLYGQRSEIGPQVDASPHGADGSPTGFDLAVTGVGSIARHRSHRRSVDDGRRRRTGPAGRDAVTGRCGIKRPARIVRAHAGSLDGRGRRSSTTRSAGSTSVPPAGRTTTPDRGWRPTGPFCSTIRRSP